MVERMKKSIILKLLGIVALLSFTVVGVFEMFIIHAFSSVTLIEPNKVILSTEIIVGLIGIFVSIWLIAGFIQEVSKDMSGLK